MDFVGIAGGVAAAGTAGVVSRRMAGCPKKYQASARTTRPAALATTRLVPGAAVSALTPSGVTSKAQVITSTAGNPSIATRMNTRSAHGGASKAGKPIDTACTASHATTRYAAPTLKTLRRLSSAITDIGQALDSPAKQRLKRDRADAASGRARPAGHHGPRRRGSWTLG